LFIASTWVRPRSRVSAGGHDLAPGTGEVGLGHGVAREPRHRVGRALAQRRLGPVDDIEQLVLHAAIEHVVDRETLARAAGHVEDHVGAHGGTEHDAAALGLVRLDRLTVERQDDRPMAGELQSEDARVGGVDQAQAQALAGAYGEGLGHAAVHGHRVANPAVVSHVVKIVEAAGDFGVARQPPIVDQPD
jgi:hypothetical protein